MYTWEQFYTKRIGEERKAEMKKLRLITYLRALLIAIGKLSIRVSFYICVMVFLYLGGEMKAEKIFVVLTCYGTMAYILSIEIPIAISHISDARAAVYRIRKLLLESSLNTENNSAIITKTPNICLSDVLVTLNRNNPFFNRINLKINCEFVGLTGPLGSGKSMLLKTILQEVEVTSGSVEVSNHKLFFF